MSFAVGTHVGGRLCSVGVAACVDGNLHACTHMQQKKTLLAQLTQSLIR